MIPRPRDVVNHPVLGFCLVKERPNKYGNFHVLTADEHIRLINTRDLLAVMRGRP